MSSFRQQSPAPVNSSAAIDSEYDYKASPPSKQQPAMDGDEALLDLAQLEELHEEAERMKALGNKHMAAQVRSHGF
jgi:hypothetical protein